MKSLCQAGVCDIAVLIDASPVDRAALIVDLFSDFKVWIQSVNSSVNVVRLNPTNIRLEEDTLDVLINLLKATEINSSGSHNVRSSIYTVRHDPLSILTNKNNCKIPKQISVRRSLRPEINSYHSGLCTLNVPMPSSVWSIQSLLSVLQLLFPLATVSCPSTLLIESWCANNVDRSIGNTGFNRLIKLATYKVFSARRCEEERRVMKKILSEFKNSGNKKLTQKLKNGKEMVSEITMLKVGILSVSGMISAGHNRGTVPVINAHGQMDSKVNNTWVSLEANAGAIIFREENSFKNTSVSNIQNLTVQGSFVKVTRALLFELFSACSVLPLRPKPLLTLSDITISMTEKAQLKYCGVNHQLRALPGGWWYDGNVYLDIGGNQRKFSPDIDEILDLFLIEKNNEIIKYNALLNDVQPFL